MSDYDQEKPSGKYKETVRFNRIDVFLVLGVLALASGYRFVETLIEGSQGTVLFGVIFSIMVGLIFLLYKMSIVIKVTHKNFKYKINPLHTKMSKIKLRDIEGFQVVNVPIETEMSGWNVRFNETPDKNLAFRSRKGIILHLRNGEELFVSCNRPKKLRDHLRSIPKLQHVA